ncbi:MAG TPA: ATP-binding protein [Candidatus Kapabacteria bacterium]|nr:ATP-binding protein [Candidatus Kapabacteria bacterium]HPO62042.1 ATP-binding protein [Candidatus Kapabacteria bacterium]
MNEINVLAVDDEFGMRTGIARTLSHFKLQLPDVEDVINFNVEIAESAEEAYEKITANQYDLLLLDYKLPGMSGLELLEKVGSKSESMLTIMITAFASLETAVSAVKSGAFDFLAKPFTPAELRKSVTKAAQNVILARQLKKLSEERKQIRFQFISVLGHELKAPLSSIDGYLYMLKDRSAGENIADYEQMVDRMIIRTDQMRKLIYDLLEMTKIESGQRQRELKTIDIVLIIKNSLDVLKNDAEKKNVTLNLNCEPSIEFEADNLEMEIILNNLISNSIKYNRDNGQVDIYINKEDNKLTIQVKDTGIGMSAEEITKLFKEFVRIKNPKTKDILGSGLGLSTVKKIAELYNGTCSVQSQPDIGSTFTVTMFEK